MVTSRGQIQGGPEFKSNLKEETYLIYLHKTHSHESCKRREICGCPQEGSSHSQALVWSDLGSMKQETRDHGRKDLGD